MEWRMRRRGSMASVDRSPSDERDLLEEIADEGFEDRRHAERAVCATVAVLAQRLTHDEARSLVRLLPEDLQAKLEPRPRRSGRTADAAELVERVGTREKISSGRAREEMQIVCGALGRRLSDDERRAIVRRLPPEIAVDFEPPLHDASLTAPPHPGRADTLATGRMGSQRPLSEATPKRALGGDR